MALTLALSVALSITILLTHGTQGDGVRVFLLQPDIWEPPRDDVYLRFNMSNQQVASSITNLTVCSRIHLTAITKLQVFLSYATREKFANAIMFYISDGKHFFRFNNKPQEVIGELKLPTVLRQWWHYCHVLSGNTYTVYVDGVALASAPLQADDRVLPLNGTFVIGQEQDGISSRFSSQQILKGYVTQVNLWSRSLNASEVETIASCRQDLNGDIFSSDVSDVELINAQEKSVSLSEICSEKERFIIFSEARNFDYSRSHCKLIGSDIYGPSTQKLSSVLNKTLWEEDLCEKEEIWVGVTDRENEGIWRRESDNTVVTDIYWGPGQPDNSTTENCIIMAARTASWNDYNCNKTYACVVCQEPKGVPLYLRGACKDMKTETMFEILSYYNSKPFFHGFYGLMIYKSGVKEWVMKDTVHNKTVATVELASKDLYPLGRHRWTLQDSLCKKPVGSRLEMSLSTCTNGEYMCNNGQCIDLSSRCDDKDDCQDETDENNCTVLKIPPGYRAFKPPKNPSDHTKPLRPTMIFNFLRFLKIEDVQQAITLEFVLSLQWTDSRLKYLNLRDEYHANRLSREETERIWHPELEFPNVKDGEKKVIKVNFFVARSNSSLPADFNSVSMDKVYGGNSARILKQQHISASFVCTFNVFYYPFDVQHCSVLVQLSSLSKQLVQLTEGRSMVKYNQNSSLTTYIISDFFTREINGSTRESMIQVGYKLTRQYTLIVLSIYLPSLMLMAIGYTTLYVNVQSLQVRLTISLTTLLVLYTFFNQTSSSLPKTAYIKMIDVWFFFCTILLFLIILVHVMVEGLERESTVAVSPSFMKGQRKVTAETVLRVVRFMVVPVILVVFCSIYLYVLLI